MTTIAPGAIIGILGGGQLGRMIAIAAAQLGYRTHIFAPEVSGPAADVSPLWTQGKYNDGEALARFAAGVDVITYEFENIPQDSVALLAGLGHVRPNALTLGIAQDRFAEKTFVTEQGGRPAPFRAVGSLADLEAAVADLGTPAILKTRRFGYDGKGQVRLDAGSGLAAAWEAVKGAPCVLEGFVRFDAEFSVILVRGEDGAIRFWDSSANVHKDGILDTSTVPACDVIAAQVPEARDLAAHLAAALGYVGVLTLEFFASAEGPVFNEMAPRVHNSGHWTIEGALTSQFENHVRAICGLPLGDTALCARQVEMRNLIGSDANAWREILADPANHLHLYGKNEARPGRKMGHVTRLIL
jgi:5-(carboxyamino)imidazole ribonucleotide synthase